MADGEIMIVPAEENWGRYADTFNRCLTYAPYTLRLSEEIIQKNIVPFIADMDGGSYAAIARDGDGREGIVHISAKGGVGALHLLLADTNDLAEGLLRLAEEWARGKGAGYIGSYMYGLNPYRFILHGCEAYCWGGLYTTRNAFSRRRWDLELDIINMYLNMPEAPDEFIPDLPPGKRCELTEDGFFENELASGGVITAKLNGDTAASGGYCFLAAISRQLGRSIGQIWIGSEASVHGVGYGRQVVAACHRRLYEMGARRVILATNNALYRAVRFYQSMGYRHELIHAYTFGKEF